MAKKSSSAESLGFRYVLSCVAATVAETATYPLDIIKTRLQIHGEDAHHPKTVSPQDTSSKFVKHHKTGMFRVFGEIVRHEGALQLWQGISPAVVRHYVYTGVRIVVYESMRENVFSHKADGKFPLWEAILSGMLSGIIAQFLASPADLVKVQMQMEGRRRLEGHKPRVTSMFNAVSKTVAEGGILSLWKGVVPNCQRAALVNMADLATYDKAKHTLLQKTSLKDNWVTHALSSVFAGLAAAVASTPADVVKTRVMNQPTDSRGIRAKKKFIQIQSVGNTGTGAKEIKAMQSEMQQQQWKKEKMSASERVKL